MSLSNISTESTYFLFFFFSSRRRHTRLQGDWSSDVCSSDLATSQPNGGKKNRCADIFITKNGDRFFLATERGDLIIARLSPKGYEEISRAHEIGRASCRERV